MSGELLQTARRRLAAPAVTGGPSRWAPIRLAARAVTSDDIPRLLDEERRLTNGFGPARLAEFATGRVLLRSVMRHDRPLGRTDTGAPCIPVGLAASLTHDRALAVAVVCAAGEVASIGIDIEPEIALPRPVADVIAGDQERHVDPLRLHVIKEACFKAWSSAGGAVIGPRAITVQVGGDRFTATIADSTRSFTGHLRQWRGRALAVAIEPSHRLGGAIGASRVGGGNRETMNRESDMWTRVADPVLIV